MNGFDEHHIGVAHHLSCNLFVGVQYCNSRHLPQQRDSRLLFLGRYHLETLAVPAFSRLKPITDNTLEPIHWVLSPPQVTMWVRELGPVLLLTSTD